jgi:hypothetical protein
MRAGAETRFSCCEAVLVDQSAKPISTLDMGWSRQRDKAERWLMRIWRREVERAVRPVAVVVVDEYAKHALGVPPVVAVKDRVEVRSELALAVADQEAQRRRALA